MVTTDHLTVMARYNRWMNTKLYAACVDIADSERKTDCGAFFGSIHRTLNHILYGDLAFLSRFTGDPPDVPDLGVDLHDSFDDLRAAREALDLRIESWLSDLTPEWLATPHTYTSSVDGVTRTVPQWVLLTHMFNHQTHHRGQVTTLLSQRGIDVGSTDLPFMPEFQD